MSGSAPQAVFLSYASQDAEEARRIAEALRAAGVEVWFDKDELVGGDAWDAKIREQIAECALFVPVISAATQARLEGYFRIEWKLAARRTHAMATAKAFLLPVVIDETRDAEAHVPDEFREVQWIKAPAGELPATFADRVRKSVNGEQLAKLRLPDERAVTPALAVRASRIFMKRRWWLAAGVVGLFMLAALARWTPQKNSAANGPAQPAAATAAVRTPAQELVAKARTILDRGDELNRETYALSEELLLKAEALDVTEVSAWVLHARISYSRLNYGIDRTPARREALRAQVARAIQLAPESLEVQLVEIDSLLYFRQDYAGLIPRVQALAENYPEDWRVADQLSRCFMATGDYEKGLAEGERALRLAPDNPRLEANRMNALVVSGRSAEAAVAIGTFREGRVSARLMAAEVYVKLMWTGDMPGAERAVQSWPAWFLREDRGVSHAALVALWNRNPAGALELVRRFTRDYVRDYIFTGPSAVLSAWANEQAGNVESARADWQTVRQTAERELQATPGDVYALHWKAWALARMGDIPGADAILQQLLEGDRAGTGVPLIAQATGRLGGLALVVGRTEVALAKLAINAPQSRPITRTVLRLNPIFDPLRGDPRFQDLISAASGPAENKPSVMANAVFDEKSVAVLPFTNLSGDKEQEYFSDGLTEEILNALARERDLRVAGRTSSFSFKGKNSSAAEIATALNVSRLVEGSVQRAGTKVRIRVSLTRVADNASEELGTFTEELADIFALQDKVARAVVDKLTHRQPASSVEVLTKNTAAYDLYLRGRALQTTSAANSSEAAKLYERAVALDPSFALAWTQLAVTKIRLYRERDNSAEIVAAARAAVGRALELKPDLPEALLTRARITRLVDGDYVAAQRDVDRAAALQPPTSELRKSQAAQALVGGDRRETARLYEEALKLDPQDGDTANTLAIQYLHLGLLSESDRLFGRAMEIAGADVSTPFSNRVELRTIWRGAASALQWVERAPADQAARDLRRLELLQRVGRLDEARKLADEIRRAVGDGADVNATQANQSKYPGVLLLQTIGREPWANSLAEKLRAAALKEFERGNRAVLVRSNLVRAEIVLGNRADALYQLEAWRRDMQRSLGAGRLINFSQRAVGLYAQLGKPDEELALLRDLVSNGFHLGYSLRTDPLLAPLRDDARFQELMKQEEAWAKTQPDPIDP